MEDALDGLVGVYDDEGGDLALFENGEGRGGELFRSDGAGKGVHGFAGGAAEGCAAFAFEQAAQVAVADDAAEQALLLYGGDAELLRGHFVDYVGHGSGGADDRDLVAGVHEVANAGQALAELAAGMEFGEVLDAEALAQADGDGEGVAEGEHGGGRGGGSEIEAAGFTRDAAIEGYVAGLGEGRVQIAGEADQGVALALEHGEQAEDFFGFAAGGERDDDVAGHEHAQVAMDGFGGVQKQGRRAGGAERGGDLLGNDAAFAHSGDDNAAVALAAAKDKLDCAAEWLGHLAFKTEGECFERCRFGADQRRRTKLCRIRRVCFRIALTRLVHRFLMVTVSAGFAASSNLVSPRPRLSYNEVERSIPLKRNTIVLTVVLFILAVFAWAGWANWEYRKQAAERALASTAQGELAPGLVTEGAGGMPQYVSPLKGKPAPAFALEDLSGKKVSLASYKGKAVLINFWATWCGPCKIETPWLVELRNQYAAQGFEVLGVSTEADDLQQDDKAGWAKDKAAIAKFVQEEQMPYPVLLDGDSISKPYGGLDDLPTSFFVDRNGTVVATQLGLTSKDDIEANIKKALGK